MSKKKGTNKINKAAYTDGTPLDRVQYLEAKLILKPDRFTSVESFRDFGKSGCDTPSQNRFTVFRTRHHVGCSLVDRIAITNEFHCHHMLVQRSASSPN
jgi:hypothetical protein